MIVQYSKPEEKAFAELTVSQKYLVELRREKPYSELKDPQKNQLCAEIITRAMVSFSPNGQADSTIIQFQATELLNELKGRFGVMTPSEIKECFRKGIREEYGQYFGMCVKTYHQFLKGWFDNPERAKSWLAYLDGVEKNQVRVAEKPALDPAYFMKAAEDAFKKYKETGTMPFAPASFYEYFKQSRGLKTLIDQKDWPEILTQSVKTYKKKAKQYIDLDNYPPIMKYKNEQGEEKENGYFVSIVKEIALRMYWDNL